MGKRKRAPQQDLTAPDGLTLLHRARMLPWSVSAVTCLAACPDGSVFAAGYEDGKVEVFDAVVYNRLAVIPGADGQEISGLAWARAAEDPCWRLFASTLSGALLELSCTQLRPIASTDSSGGAVWCLRAAPCTTSSSSGSKTSSASRPTGLFTSQLAAACADGSVKLFSVSSGEPGAQFLRALPRVEGNVLSLAWHPNGRNLVSGGSDGCMHVWDLLTGTEQQRITVGSSSTTPPCVWALEVLADGTLVSGDQEGAVQFWDGRFGTLLVRHSHFVADVLALAASPDGRSVWASGVDPKVVLYQAVADKAKGGSTWTYMDRKQPHAHDVRALAALQSPDSDPLLLSGGNDGQIMLYNMPLFLKQHPHRQTRAPQRPFLQLAAGARPALLLQAQHRALQLWQLGQPAGRQGLSARKDYLEGQDWDLAAKPSLLASIHTSSSSHICTAALAPDGAAVAAADKHKLRLFRLQTQQQAKDQGVPALSQQQQQQQQQQLVISRIQLQQQPQAPVVSCVFSADSNMLFAATGSGQLLAFGTASGQLLASQQLGLSSSSSSKPGGNAHAQTQKQQQQQAWCSRLAWAMPTVSCMSTSPDGHILAVASAAGVQLLCAAAGDALLQPLRWLSLLGEPAAVTSVAFNSSSRVVAVSTATNSFSAYEVSSGLPTQWTLKNQEAVAELMEQLPGSVCGLSFKPCVDAGSGALSVLAYSPGGFCHIDMQHPLQQQHQPALSSKQRQLLRKQQYCQGKVPVNPASMVGTNGRLLKLEDSCLLLGHSSSSEVVLLEKPWQEVLQGLLPPVYRAKYGT